MEINNIARPTDLNKHGTLWSYLPHRCLLRVRGNTCVCLLRWDKRTTLRADVYGYVMAVPDIQEQNCRYYTNISWICCLATVGDATSRTPSSRLPPVHVGGFVAECVPDRFLQGWKNPGRAVQLDLVAQIVSLVHELKFEFPRLSKYVNWDNKKICSAKLERQREI